MTMFTYSDYYYCFWSYLVFLSSCYGTSELQVVTQQASPTEQGSAPACLQLLLTRNELANLN